MPTAPKKTLTMADKYAAAYFLLLKSEDKNMQARIRAAKDNPDVNDSRVDAFIKRVIEAAERENDSK